MVKRMVKAYFVRCEYCGKRFRITNDSKTLEGFKLYHQGGNCLKEGCINYE